MSAIFFHNQNNSTLSPGLLGNGALTCSRLHFCRSRLLLIFDVISSLNTKLGHVIVNGHFARGKLKLEMAPFYNSSQSKKLQPNLSLDERIDICARALLNDLLQV